MSKDSGIVETIARMKVAIDEVLDAEIEKNKEPEGVMLHAGEKFTFQGQVYIALRDARNTKDKFHWHRVEDNVEDVYHTPDYRIITLDGRPIIGFRDNDEGGK